MSTFPLNCLLLNEDPKRQNFTVEIPENKNVSFLKEKIKEQKARHLAHLDASDLILWKVRLPPDQSQISSLTLSSWSRQYPSRRAGPEIAQDVQAVQVHLPNEADEGNDHVQPLDAVENVSDYWEDSPQPKHLHILVQKPAANESVPSISPFWSPRSDTVHRLYEILLSEKLVHVRGTPGCGKTTLMNLLHAHIRKQMPSSSIFTHHSWDLKPAESAVVVKQRLQQIDPAFPRKSLTFLLFDEAQDSYGDPYFWNAFIKEVGDGIYPFYRVILFCSYGSPTSHPVEYEIGSPASVRARISLWPVEMYPGMLLQWSEFQDVVSHSERPLKVDPDLLNLIFIWTVGHVGAVVELLRLMSYSRVSETRQGKEFTVQDFYDENPLHLLVRHLEAGAFGRGLPRAFSQDFVTLFRRLLKDRQIEMKDEEADATVVKCHRRGWIYATLIPGGVPSRYTFPSPLHEACLSWKLEPRNDMPNFPSVFELSLEVISKFRPSQLQLPLRRVGSASTLPPEAQYQDEYYNSLLAATFGNVCISPEYASAQAARVAGRIDFFIPVVKWGIEITRDGDRLLGHAARFTGSGAYGAWLKSADMNDYILLDFRTKNLRAPHPTIPNLYHVVFRNEYREVLVYNNRLQVVKGPVALLENH